MTLRRSAPTWVAILTLSTLSAGCGSRSTTLDPGADAGDLTIDADRARLDSALDAEASDARAPGCTGDDECPDDGQRCNGVSFCDVAAGRCAVTAPVRCDDLVDCTSDRCVEGVGCVFTPEASRCAPGALCDPIRGCLPACTPTSSEEERCDDRADDDCDGLLDCDDPDCEGAPACPIACTPSAPREVRCRDGRDDDCDGLVDCLDVDCTEDPACASACVPSAPREVQCRDGRDDDCDGRVDCRDADCASDPACRGGCVPTAHNEIGVGACTNRIDDDCDGRADCDDPDCRPLGAMAECCNGVDDNGDGNVDEFTCRCFADADCFGVGSIDQSCWTTNYSVCGPRCNFYGGDRFCQEGFGLSRCDRETGECL